MFNSEYNLELAKRKIKEEFERFCGSHPEDCSGCKYDGYDVSCEINYILDNFTLKRNGEE